MAIVRSAVRVVRWRIVIGVGLCVAVVAASGVPLSGGVATAAGAVGSQAAKPGVGSGAFPPVGAGDYGVPVPPDDAVGAMLRKVVVRPVEGVVGAVPDVAPGGMSSPAGPPGLSDPSGDFRGRPRTIPTELVGVDTEPRLPWEMGRLRVDGGSVERDFVESPFDVAVRKGTVPPVVVQPDNANPKAVAAVSVRGVGRGVGGGRKDWVDGVAVRKVPEDRFGGGAAGASRCVGGRFVGDGVDAPQDVPVDAVEAAALCSVDPTVRAGGGAGTGSGYERC